MKVLFIHCRYRLQGGEDGVVTAEIELLRSKGIEVQLLEFKNEGSSFLKMIQLPFNVGAYLKTYRHVKRFKPDIVHIHNLHFGASTSILYALKNLKVASVLTLHNFRLLCPSGTLYFNGNPYLKSLNTNFPWAAVKDGVYNHSKVMTFWLSFSTWINRLIGTFDIVNRYIVLTGHAKTIFEKSRLRLDHKKIIVKPNFVYDPKIVAGSRKGNFLYIGRLSEEKGIKVLLKAFEGSNHTLKIIGDGPEKKQVEAAVKTNSNITYLGFQKKDVITEELKACNALIFPSVWYETFGLTIIEAFATSTPVIASNIASPSILINDGYNGLHFKESDAHDLRNKLDKWESFSENKKEVYRHNARKSYDLYYTPAGNFEQLLSIYTTVIDEKKRTIRAWHQYGQVSRIH